VSGGLKKWYSKVEDVEDRKVEENIMKMGGNCRLTSLLLAIPRKIAIFMAVPEDLDVPRLINSDSDDSW
jgi:hypothetical protein